MDTLVCFEEPWNFLRNQLSSLVPWNKTRALIKSMKLNTFYSYIEIKSSKKWSS